MQNQNFEFRWEFGDFCIRTNHEDWEDTSSPIRKSYPIELIRYLDKSHKSCYVVAWFVQKDEGYELHFIGNRPLKDISTENIGEIWRQLQAAQKMLDAYFEACEQANI